MKHPQFVYEFMQAEILSMHCDWLNALMDVESGRRDCSIPSALDRNHEAKKAARFIDLLIRTAKTPEMFNLINTSILLRSWVPNLKAPLKCLCSHNPQAHRPECNVKECGCVKYIFAREDKNFGA